MSANFAPLEMRRGLSSPGRSLALAALFVAVLCPLLIWLVGSRNPFTPAGYVGYLTRGAVFGRSTFYGVQHGPTSPGRSWLLAVTNVSITPYTYSEDFTADNAVLSKDNLKIAFRVHTVWRVDEARVPLFMERFSTTMSEQGLEKEPDAIVKVAYGNFIREPLRTFARDEVQQRNGLEVKDAFIPIGDSVLKRIRAYAADSPFVISSVVVGNVQYPAEVADAVSRKLAATQELQRKDTEIEIERKERTKREVQAQGIANAMEIIRGQLSAMYIQHEAIEGRRQWSTRRTTRSSTSRSARWACRSPGRSRRCRPPGQRQRSKPMQRARSLPDRGPLRRVRTQL